MSNVRGRIPTPLKDVGCQELIARHDVVHHGNLRRRGLLNRMLNSLTDRVQLSQVIRWRQSYIILLNGCMYIYDNEMSAKPARAFSLYGFTDVIPCGPEVSKDISWPFKLICALEDRERTYYFSAPSEKDMTLWMKNIHDQLMLANNMRAPIPTASVSPQLNQVRAVLTGQPPLLPPREKVSKAEYVLEKDDGDDDDWDDDWSNDYTEIADEDLDEMKDTPEEGQRNIRDELERKLQIFDRTVHKDSKNIGERERSATPDLKPGKRLPPSVAPKTQIKSFSFDTGFDTKQPRLFSWQVERDVVEYMAAPDYLELRDDDPTLTGKGTLTNVHWKGTAEDADAVMKAITYTGAYMLRDSSEKGVLTLLVRINANVIKYKIQVDERGRSALMTSGPYFDSMAALINFYHLNPLPNRTATLTLPYLDLQKK